MSSADPPFDVRVLLAHDRWLRDLAASLVDDAHAADDLAQQAWVIALERRPNGTSLHGWLAGTLRHLLSRLRRSDARRAARERAAARAELLPSEEQLRAREAARRVVADAVLALEEPYRTTVALRWFEGLPPREIGRRMGVPVETVRTRTRRALERLRLALDATHGGDRRAWATALGALARPDPGLVALASSFLGALLVTAKTKIACVSLACVALAFALWQILSPHAGAPAGGAGDAGAVPAVASRPATLPGSDPAPLARAPVAAASTASTGALLVRAQWAEGPVPAAGIALTVARQSREQPEFDEHLATTDARGEALLAGLVPGTFVVSLANGASRLGRVVAGECAEVAFTLPAGAAIEGVVLDAHDAPVAGAAIEVAAVMGAPGVAGSSAADGTFRLRHIVPEAGMKIVYVGARKAGHAPSPRAAVDLAAPKTERLVLVLRRAGGDVRGVVRGPEGKPVEGAFVQVVGETPTVSGSEMPPSPPPRARTGAEGRFLVVGLAPGTHRVTVRARGLAPEVRAVEVVAGQGSLADFDLVQGVTVAGRITSGAGEGAKDVRVAVGEVVAGVPRALANTATLTGADGAYVLRGLAPGEIAIVAAAGGELGVHGTAKATLVARPGDELRWDATLEAGQALRGRVIDERGAPVRGAQVRGTIKARPPLVGQATTAADGRFAFASWRDAPTDIEVQVDQDELYPRASVAGASPRDEVVIVLRDDRRPTVRITGVVLDPDGKPAAAARLGAMPLAHDYAPRVRVGERGVDPRTGAFEVGPVFPGWWTLRIDAPGCVSCVVPARELAAGETWRIGDVHLARPAALRIEAKLADGKPLPKARFQIGSPEDALLTFVAIENGTGRVELAPGQHLVQAQAEGCAWRCVPVDVAATGETKLEVVLESGVTHALRFVLPGGQFARMLREVVRDERGTAVVDQWVWGAGSRDWKLCLAPGSYRVEATTPNGWRGAAAFAVGTEPRSEPTVVELR